MVARRCRLSARQRLDMMNSDLARVRDVLPQYVAVSNAFPGVQQFRARCGDALNGVEERFAQHDIWQRAFVHVEPDVVSPVSVPFVHQHHI